MFTVTLAGLCNLRHSSTAYKLWEDPGVLKFERETAAPLLKQSQDRLQNDCQASNDEHQGDRPSQHRMPQSP